jgi:hypothetical protein
VVFHLGHVSRGLGAPRSWRPNPALPLKSQPFGLPDFAPLGREYILLP